MSTDSNRPEHSTTDEDAREEQQHEGQVSEASKPGGEVGGADATDKSTGTAPKVAGEGRPGDEAEARAAEQPDAAPQDVAGSE